jgi:hypothetical protein
VRHTRVTGLRYEGDAVRGVRHLSEGGPEVLAADFTVDATGRAGRLPDWLAAIDHDQWIVTLIGYDDDRPGRTLDAFRAACAKLPPPFAEATAADPVADISVYRQAESRRRDFAGLAHLPARLVSVGDAVAPFNPVYGQGMTSAALHASCLSWYLRTSEDVTWMLAHPATLAAATAFGIWCAGISLSSAKYSTNSATVNEG